jgi:4-hydroxy-tetrahydrodipicolinate reductase
MNIALIGYGKMGKAIEEIALQRHHTIILKIDEFNITEFTKENLSKADVAIEFTSPHSAYENVKKALDSGCPVVCGSTGWTEKSFVKKRMEAFCMPAISALVSIFFLN